MSRFWTVSAQLRRLTNYVAGLIFLGRTRFVQTNTVGRFPMETLVLHFEMYMFVQIFTKKTNIILKMSYNKKGWPPTRVESKFKQFVDRELFACLDKHSQVISFSFSPDSQCIIVMYLNFFLNLSQSFL